MSEDALYKTCTNDGWQESDSSSLQHLSRQHFANLLKDLELNETERSAFCTRQGDQSDTKKLKTDQWVGRKIDLKVEAGSG